MAWMKTVTNIQHLSLIIMFIDGPICGSLYENNATIILYGAAERHL